MINLNSKASVTTQNTLQYLSSDTTLQIGSEMKSGRNSNSSEILWLSLLNACMKKIQHKISEIVFLLQWSKTTEEFKALNLI